MECLATLEEFKNEVELWRNQGHENVVVTRFEDDEMILLIQDYVYPERSLYIAISYNPQTIFCAD